MLNWIAKKAQNSRVYMCIKEVKWELETASPIRRATILAMSQLIRGQMIAETDFPREVLDRPLDFPRNDLMRVYEMLEDIRNQTNLQLESTKKLTVRLGFELPEFAVQQARATARGVEVWMCTLGAGIAPERRDDVRLVWSYLAASLGEAASAIALLRDVEKKTHAMTGYSGETMFPVHDEDWLAFCRYVPYALRQHSFT